MAGAQDGEHPSQEVGLDGWWDGVTNKNTTIMDHGGNWATWDYLHWAVGHDFPFPLGPAFDDTVQHKPTGNERAPLHQTGVCGLFDPRFEITSNFLTCLDHLHSAHNDDTNFSFMPAA